MGTDTEMIEKCEKVKMDASLKLMSLAAEACRKRLDQNRTQVDSTDTAVIKRKEDLRKRKEKKTEKVRLFNVFTSEEDFDAYNYVVRKVKSDGNCFYRCIALSLHGSQDRHAEIREAVVEHMRKNRDMYEMFIDSDFVAHLRDQTHTDGRVESWATEAEIAAASKVFQSSIMVYKMDYDTRHPMKFVPGNNLRAKRYIFIKLENSHFDLLYAKPRDPKSNADTGYKQTKPKTGTFDWFDMTYEDGIENVNTTPENKHRRDEHVTEAQHSQHMTDSCKQMNGQRSQNTPLGSKHETVQNEETMSGLKKKMVKTTNNPKNIKKEKRDIVTNLSSRKLSDAEISLLTKGFTFIPTRNQIDMVKVQSDLSEWERRMRLREYFYDKEDNREEEEDPWRKKKGTFTPTPGRDKWLDAYIDAVKSDVINGIQKKVESNLAKEERKALVNLLNDASIVIRPADKGSGIVVIDTDEYVEKLEREMTISNTYMQTDGSKLAEAEKKVKVAANKMYKSGWVSKELRNYLIPKQSVRGKLRGNPKLHKANNPYRTIVNGIGTPTERMAEIAEKELNEYVEGTPSYIRDTNDFLNKLGGLQTELPENAIMFCFDVVKLYPSIPRKEGMEACEVALKSRTSSGISTAAVQSMVSTVLENNVFEFNGKEYVQTDGIAIGSKLGRNFACTYMRQWDEKLLSHHKQPLFYKRYIDDGFGIWMHGLDELQKFNEVANKIHPNIKVELRWSKSQIEFLDTWVKLVDGHIETDLYVKPTDKHMYVDRKSCHPINVKKAIPYGLGIRLKRICTKDSDYNRHRNVLKSNLRKRGYSGKFLESQLQKADDRDRSDILSKTSQRCNTERVPLVLTYTRQLPGVHDITRKHLPTLHKSARLTEVFQEPPLVAFRRDRNMADVLVHGKLNRVMKGRCNLPTQQCDPTCMTCQMFRFGSHMTDMGTSGSNECTTSNVVYALTCSVCEEIVYIGETGRATQERLKEHEADTRHRRDKPVAHHFNGDGHASARMGAVVLEAVKDDSRTYRQLKEQEWISKLSPVVNCKQSLAISRRTCL